MKDLARTPKQLGNLIRTARKNKYWTQADLARNTSLQQRQISVIENGYSSTKLHTLLEILAVLDLDLQIVSRSTGEWKLGH